MRKHVKRGVVDNYLKKNPDAKARAVSEATGCHVATVHLARKRLGILKPNQMVFEYKAPEPVAAEPSYTHSLDRHHIHDSVMETMRGDYAKERAAIYGLSLIIAVTIAAFGFR